MQTCIINVAFSNDRLVGYVYKSLHHNGDFKIQNDNYHSQ